MQLLSVAQHSYTDRFGNEIVEAAIVKAIDPPPCVCDIGILRQIAQCNGSIAVIRDGHLGDLLMLSAPIRALHKSLPDLGIHMFCDQRFTRVFKHNSNVCSFSETNHREVKKYTYAVDLRGYVERHELANTVDRTSLFGHAFGVEVTDGKADFVVEEADSAKASLRVAALSHIEQNGRFVVIAPDASDKRRALPGNFVDALSLALLSEGFSVFVTGTDRGEMVELGELGALLQKASAVVCGDNGVYHLADAVGNTPSFPLFTTIDPQLRCRWYANCYPVLAAVDCAPCAEDARPGCKHECIHAFNVDDIVERLLSKI